MTRNSGFRFICYMHGGFDGDLFVLAYTGRDDGIEGERVQNSNGLENE